MSRRYYGINRYLCSVLDDMRKCCETSNFAPMRGLIEEAQILGNRMESGLGDKKDLLKMAEEKSELKREIKKLREEAKQLKIKTGKKVEKDDVCGQFLNHNSAYVPHFKNTIFEWTFETDFEF